MDKRDYSDAGIKTYLDIDTITNQVIKIKLKYKIMHF